MDVAYESLIREQWDSNWGYCGAIAPSTWGAHYLLDTPLHLLATLNALAESARSTQAAA